MTTYRRARAGEETRQMAARGVVEVGPDDGISVPSARDLTGTAQRDVDDGTKEGLRRGCGAEGHRGDLLLGLCNRSN